jgi:hypothetical protein
VNRTVGGESVDFQCERRESDSCALKGFSNKKEGIRKLNFCLAFFSVEIRPFIFLIFKLMIGGIVTP